MAKLSGSMARQRQEEAWEFRLIFFASFIVFLLVAGIGRCLPPQWRACPPGPGECKSIIEEAKQAANIVAPFAFMG